MINDALGSVGLVMTSSGEHRFLLRLQALRTELLTVAVSLHIELRIHSQAVRLTTGLYYYGARYYDPSISRFITEDSPQYSNNIQDPLSLNRYIYVKNNPETINDPSDTFTRILQGAEEETETYAECAKMIGWVV
jgi:RHS repeat-associated protein